MFTYIKVLSLSLSLSIYIYIFIYLFIYFYLFILDATPRICKTAKYEPARSEKLKYKIVN